MLTNKRRRPDIGTVSGRPRKHHPDPSMEQYQVGPRLRRARETAGLTQMDVQRAGVISATSLSMIEGDIRSTTIYTMINLARLYGTTLSAILEGVT